MADYYTKFSFCIRLGAPALAGALALKRVLDATMMGEDVKPHVQQKITHLMGSEESLGDFLVEAQGDHLWVHDDAGSCNLNSVAAWVQHLLKRWHRDGVVYFHWSNDCSKPRTDAYGGGACFITADDVRHHSTWDWLNGQLEEINGDGAEHLNP